MYQSNSSGMYVPALSMSPLEHIAYAAISTVPQQMYCSQISTPTIHYTSPQGPSLASVSSQVTPVTQPSHSGYKLSSKSEYQTPLLHREYHFDPDLFLKPGKDSIFVGNAQKVESFVKQTFELLCNAPFPSNIKLSILEEKEFRKVAPSPQTIGLSLNRTKQGLLSEIFILAGSLGRVMLTIGHELGHVLTPTLPNAHSEEAKAYAFSFLWLQIIKEHNIANLQNALITEIPATNGLHDLAFSFVTKQHQQGREFSEIYEDLIHQKVNLTPSLI